MGDEMGIGLQDELIADLTQELQRQPTFTIEAITLKVISAIKEVTRARKYPAYYTDEQINADLYGFYSNIRNIALFDFSQIGAPFESSHNENSVSRSWTDRNKLFAGIIPIAKL